MTVYHLLAAATVGAELAALAGYGPTLTATVRRLPPQGKALLAVAYGGVGWHLFLDRS